MATRALKHNEIYELARDEKFVATVQSAVLHKCIYLYDFHKATIESAGGFDGMSDQAKAEWNFSFTSLINGSVGNNVGFARLFAVYLLNDAVGINVPEEGGQEVFTPQGITDVMVADGIISRDNPQLNKVWGVFLENVGIATAVNSWIVQ